jgi:hypothetical protein
MSESVNDCQSKIFLATSHGVKFPFGPSGARFAATRNLSFSHFKLMDNLLPLVWKI